MNDLFSKVSAKKNNKLWIKNWLWGISTKVGSNLVDHIMKMLIIHIIPSTIIEKIL